MNPAPPVTRTVVTAPTVGSGRRRCPTTSVLREPVSPRRGTRPSPRCPCTGRAAGMQDTEPCGFARPRPAARAVGSSRRRRHPATPSAPHVLAAAMVFVTCTSTMASWKLAATSGRSSSRPAARSALHVAQHRRLQPAHREVEVPARPPSPAGTRSRAGHPPAPWRRSAGPPGNPSPSSRATLSNASPAASSRVWPRTSWWWSSGTCTSIVWPPLTISATYGGSGGPWTRKFAQ